MIRKPTIRNGYNCRSNKAVENDHGVFEEKQYTDIWTNDEYLQFMYERIDSDARVISG